MILHTNHYIRTIMKKNLLSLGGSAFAAFLFIFSFSSCHDEAAENVSELAYRHSYEDNFVKLFGEVSPNKTWDFSVYDWKTQAAATRAGSYTTLDDDEDGYWDVPVELIQSIAEEFPEHGITGTNWESKIHPFMLQTSYSAQTFDIAYIYQGFNEPVWDLYCCIQKSGETTVTTKKLFSKGQVMVSTDNGSRYHDVGTANRYAGTIIQTAGAATQTKDDDEFAYHEFVKAPVKTITVPALSTVYFYLLITAESCERPQGGNPRFAIEGDVIQSIDEGTFEDGSVYTPIGLIDIDASAYVPEGNESYILACEDYCIIHQSSLTTEGKSVDYNDMLFLISGSIPEEVDPKQRKLSFTKRYFIEDLYGYDYDFNDIVVDATNNEFYTWIDTNGDNHVDQEIREATTQSATIVHQCGTLPYQIKVGDTYFGQVTDPTNSDLTAEQLIRGENVLGGSLTTAAPTGYNGINPNYTKQITGWDPDQNNITAWIWTKGTDPQTARPESSSSSVTTSNGVWTSTFPAAGEVPYIIAVDHDQEWTNERQIISEKISSFNTEGWLPNK